MLNKFMHKFIRLWENKKEHRNLIFHLQIKVRKSFKRVSTSLSRGIWVRWRSSLKWAMFWNVASPKFRCWYYVGTMMVLRQTVHDAPPCEWDEDSCKRGFMQSLVSGPSAFHHLRKQPSFLPEDEDLTTARLEHGLPSLQNCET